MPTRQRTFCSGIGPVRHLWTQCNNNPTRSNFPSTKILIVTHDSNPTATIIPITGDETGDTSPPLIVSTILSVPTPASLTATSFTSTTSSPMPTTVETTSEVSSTTNVNTPAPTSNGEPTLAFVHCSCAGKLSTPRIKVPASWHPRGLFCPPHSQLV
ncbi:hypothetical protein SprV_0602131100 [Sparganum proliferum]